MQEDKEKMLKELAKYLQDQKNIDKELEISRTKFIERISKGLADEIKTTKGVKIIKTPKWKLTLKRISEKVMRKVLYILYLLKLYK